MTDHPDTPDYECEGPHWFDDDGQGPSRAPNPLEVVNGVRLQAVADAAVHMAQRGTVSATSDEIKAVGFIGPSEAEYNCAVSAARWLLKARQSGYSKETAQWAFWSKIIELARGATP